MKCIVDAMKFGTQSRSSSWFINMVFEIADLDPKLKAWSDSVSKLQYAPIFMKFSTLNKSNMLIMNTMLVSV